MREDQRVEWTRTKLQPLEREELLAALTSEQKAQLLEHDYVWVEGVGVLWNPPHGDPLRRASFTHETHFQTERGEFLIDSQGSVQISDRTPSRLEVKHERGAFGFNAATEVYEDLVEGGALQNAASVASLLLTTEALIAHKPEK
jgi:hypothetical protein